MVFPWDMSHPLKHALSIGQVKKTNKKKHTKKPSNPKNRALLTYHNNAILYKSFFYALLLINQHIHVN